jgi:hypothetical protein
MAMMASSAMMAKMTAAIVAASVDADDLLEDDVWRELESMPLSGTVVRVDVVDSGSGSSVGMVVGASGTAGAVVSAVGLAVGMVVGDKVELLTTLGVEVGAVEGATVVGACEGTVVGT